MSAQDDFDRQFRELIEAEYGSQAAKPARGDWYSLDESLEASEADELCAGEKWNPEGQSLQLSKRGKLVIAILILAFALAIIGGFTTPSLGVAAMACFALALILSLSMIPKKRDDYPDEPQL